MQLESIPRSPKQESISKPREMPRVIVPEQRFHLDVYSTKLDRMKLGIQKTMNTCRNLFKTYEMRSKGSPMIRTAELALTEAQGELFKLQGEISREAGTYTGPRDADFEQLMKYGQEVNEKITEVSDALYNLKRIENGMAIDLEGNALSIQTGERLPSQYKVSEPSAVKPSDMPAWAKGMPTPTPPKSFWGKVKRFFSY